MKYQAGAGEKSMYGPTWNSKFILSVLSIGMIVFFLIIANFEWINIFQVQRGLRDLIPYVISCFSFIVVSGCLFIILQSFWGCHLEVSRDGIVNYSFGHKVYSPWNNIAGLIVGPVYPPVAGQQSSMYLQFREKAFTSASIIVGKQRNIAVIEKSWWLSKNARFIRSDKILLSLPGLTFPYYDWQNSEFAFYFEHCAPEAYQRSIESMGEVHEEK